MYERKFIFSGLLSGPRAITSVSHIPLLQEMPESE